jgi:hypothetical protein
MATVADVLKRIERLKKDLEYVRSFQEKWRDQRERFPEIYEGIQRQERAFLKKIDDMKGLRVDTLEALGGDFETSGAAPAIIPAGQDAPASGSAPAAASTESSDEKRAAAIDGIGEKLRKRQKTDTAPSVPAVVVAESVGGDASAAAK